MFHQLTFREQVDILSAYSFILLTMARPRSDDKKQMILQAATKLLAQEGITAPTSRIAKAAGVAEGTIFTYFATKDELLNELYLDLKKQLRSSLLPSEEKAELRDKVFAAWHTYVSWGVSNPDGHQVLAMLGVSSKVTAATKKEGDLAFCDVSALLEEAIPQKALSPRSVAFAGAIMGAIGDVTMTFMSANPTSADQTCMDGFNAFWNAITTA